MMNAESYREYAADCVRQAHDEEAAGDRNILLNVALAWLRLAQQTEANDPDAVDPATFDESGLAADQREQAS